MLYVIIIEKQTKKWGVVIYENKNNNLKNKRKERIHSNLNLNLIMQKKYETYTKIKLLGEGSFGKAFLVECNSDKVSVSYENSNK